MMAGLTLTTKTTPESEYKNMVHQSYLVANECFALLGRGTFAVIFANAEESRLNLWLINFAFSMLIYKHFIRHFLLTICFVEWTLIVSGLKLFSPGHFIGCKGDAQAEFQPQARDYPGNGYVTF